MLPASGSKGSAPAPLVDLISRMLAESATLVDAAPAMLEAICAAFGWEYGGLWEVDRAGKALRSLGNWHEPSLPFDEFSRLSQATVFSRGVGLPGRVWARGEPAWVADIASDPNFPRSATANRAGLQSAFGLPVLRGTHVLGVMEFFSRNRREPDARLLRTMATVAGQIGLSLDRKWAADELERFFTLSLDLLCVASLDGQFLRVNPAWTRVLGYTEATLTSAPFIDFVHPDDRTATIDALSTLAGGEHVIDFENRYRASDGSYRWLQWTASPMPDQNAVYAAARDVTDRKLGEVALQDSADRLAQLVR